MRSGGSGTCRTTPSFRRLSVSISIVPASRSKQRGVSANASEIRQPLHIMVRQNKRIAEVRRSKALRKRRRSAVLRYFRPFGLYRLMLSRQGTARDEGFALFDD